MAMSQWIEIAKEAMKLPALLPEIYGDLLKPGVKQAGIALETVIGLGNTLLWPFALANARAKIALEKNLEKYREEIKHLPEEKVAPVLPEIGVPILEKLSYVTDEELSDLYVNLLAKASCVDTVQFAHPAFANIINNLSPDEALLLKELDRRGRDSIPYISARWIRKEPREYIEFAEMLTKLEEVVLLAFPKNLFAYFSNLDGLGIVRIERTALARMDAAYRELQEFYLPYFEKYMKENIVDPKNFGSETEYGRIELTPFGKLFLDSCLRKFNREDGAPAP
jgi:hypothetical protein